MYGLNAYGTGVYHGPVTDLRLSRLSVEVGRNAISPDLRLSRLSVEAGRNGINADFRLSRLSVEVVGRAVAGGPVWGWSSTTSAAWHII